MQDRWWAGMEILIFTPYPLLFSSPTTAVLQASLRTRAPRRLRYWQRYATTTTRSTTSSPVRSNTAFGPQSAFPHWRRTLARPPENEWKYPAAENSVSAIDRNQPHYWTQRRPAAEATSRMLRQCTPTHDCPHSSPAISQCGVFIRQLCTAPYRWYDQLNIHVNGIANVTTRHIALERYNIALRYSFVIILCIWTFIVAM